MSCDTKLCDLDLVNEKRAILELSNLSVVGSKIWQKFMNQDIDGESRNFSPR